MRWFDQGCIDTANGDAFYYSGKDNGDAQSSVGVLVTAGIKQCITNQPNGNLRIMIYRLCLVHSLFDQENQKLCEPQVDTQLDVTTTTLTQERKIEESAEQIWNNFKDVIIEASG